MQIAQVAFLFWLTDTEYMKLILIRHGETDSNAHKLMMGQDDIPLNNIGRQQARDKKIKLSDIQFDALYSSDLSRTVETCQIIFDQRPILDQRFREVDFGNANGMQIEDFIAEVNSIPHALHIDRKMGETGESPREFHERIYRAIDSLSEKHRNQTVVIVTHAGVFRRVDAAVTNKTFAESFSYDLPNLTVQEFDIVEPLMPKIEQTLR